MIVCEKPNFITLS